MQEQERPLMDRVWEFTKDLSVKFSRKAEKHWKINTLKVEIASVRHRINNKYKDLGRYVYQSLRSQTLEEDSYKATLREFFDDIQSLEAEILDRENRIELLEMEMRENPESNATDQTAENPMTSSFMPEAKVPGQKSATVVPPIPPQVESDEGLNTHSDDDETEQEQEGEAVESDETKDDNQDRVLGV